MRNSTLCLAFALAAVLALGGTAVADSPGKESTARGDGAGSDKAQVGRGLQGVARAFGDRNGKGETGSFLDWYTSVIARTIANRNGNGGGFRDGGLGRLGGLGGGRGVSTNDVVDRVLSFDKDKDGKVTKDELPERLEGQIAKGDTNKDDALGKEEIMKLATTGREGRSFGRAPAGASRSADLEKRIEQLRKELRDLRRQIQR